jgi:hypothetical protein
VHSSIDRENAIASGTSDIRHSDCTAQHLLADNTVMPSAIDAGAVVV